VLVGISVEVGFVPGIVDFEVAVFAMKRKELVVEVFLTSIRGVIGRARWIV